MVTSSSVTYAGSGVNTKETDTFTSEITAIARNTHNNAIKSTIGGFNAIIDPKALAVEDPLWFFTCDGVGSKLKLAKTPSQWHGIGIDLVAMSVNDVLVNGASAIGFLDYIACHRFDKPTLSAILEGVADGCRQAGCALMGGETAIMPSVYGKDKYDLAGFCVAIAERDHVLHPQDAIRPNDVLIGLGSSGFHSNGFSLIHNILERISPDALDHPWHHNHTTTLREELLTPTVIYSAILGLNHHQPSKTRQHTELIPRFRQAIHGIAHITGGGLSANLSRVLPHNLEAIISNTAITGYIPPIFTWIADQGPVSQEEMRHVFNHGIGMVLVVSADKAEEIVAHATTNAHTGAMKTGIIGSIGLRGTQSLNNNHNNTNDNGNDNKQHVTNAVKFV